MLGPLLALWPLSKTLLQSSSVSVGPFSARAHAFLYPGSPQRVNLCKVCHVIFLVFLKRFNHMFLQQWFDVGIFLNKFQTCRDFAFRLPYFNDRLTKNSHLCHFWLKPNLDPNFPKNKDITCLCIVWLFQHISLLTFQSPTINLLLTEDIKSARCRCVFVPIWWRQRFQFMQMKRANVTELPLAFHVKVSKQHPFIDKWHIQ